MAEAPIIAVSDKAALQVTCKVENPALHDTSGRVVKEKERRLVAQFVRGGAPDWVIEEATKRFKFGGRGDGESPAMMIGVFDSEIAARQNVWSEEETDSVIRHLRDTQNPKWFIAEQPKVAAPWSSYDALVVQGQRTAEKVAARNVELAAETGTPVELLIAYERQNRNDQRILAAYLEAQAGTVNEPGELVEA